MQTNLVVWDIDRVWYPDISTTYAAKGSKADFRPYLTALIGKDYFTRDHVKYWEQQTGRTVSSVGDVADMLTDFMYTDMRNEVYSRLDDKEVKRRAVEGKQSLLKGASFGDIKGVADSVPYTEGLKDCVSSISIGRIHQAGFSDGFGPFVAYIIEEIEYQTGSLIDVGGIIPARVEIQQRGRREERIFNENTTYLLLDNSGIFLEKHGNFDKKDAIFEYIRKRGYQLPSVAAIDDSASNLSILTRIRDGNGVAIGFRPTKSHMPKFEEAKIPVLKGEDLRPFAEIVKDRRKIKEYCETWGLDV